MQLFDLTNMNIKFLLILPQTKNPTQGAGSRILRLIALL